MIKSRKFAVIVIFISGFLVGIGTITVSKLIFSSNGLYADTNTTNTMGNPDIDDDNFYKYFPMFKNAYLILKKEFYDKNEVTTKKLIYGAIKGMTENVNDPYTTFMEPTIAKEFNIDISGSFGGLGIQIDMRDGWLTVVSPMEDTPAWKAGIKPNDKIVEIEGKSTKGISVKEAIDIMRGKAGTKVTITIGREGITEPFKVTMKREEIKIKTVKSDVIDFNKKKFGYIKMSEFSMPTAVEFKAQLSKLIDKSPDGLIVDLRHNPGGLLDVVAKCVNYFQSDGLIVYTRGRLPENNNDFFAYKDNSFVPLDLPMVVMINQGSASASEIFAGAMRDTGRAVLVGMKSFGKGSVQKTFPFPDDGSQIKYTVAKYFTPSGECIDKVGLQPNVEVKMWYETLTDEEKNTLIKLQNTNIIKDFISKYPNPDETQVADFQKSLQNSGTKLSLDTIKTMIHMKKAESQLPAVYDIESDNQLLKALSVLTNYREYQKPYKIYHNPK